MSLSRAQDARSPEALCRISSGSSCDSAELAAFEQAPAWFSGSHYGEITPIKVSKSCCLKLAKGLRAWLGGLAVRQEPGLSFIWCILPNPTQPGAEALCG